VSVVAEDAMKQVQEWVDVHPFAAMHDNVNIAYKVSSQRMDNQNHFDSGTALIVIALPLELAPILENESCHQELDQWEDAAEKPTLNWHQITYAARQAAPAINKMHVYHIL
jgi:hypothetical protein